MPKRANRPKWDRYAKVRLAHALLHKLADTQEPYSDKAMSQATGWKSPGTYRGKFWHDWVWKDSNGIWHVDPSFKSVTVEKLIEIHSQRKDTLSSYQRRIYFKSVTYEFFLPLTNEHELRETLDNLFYRDTIERRLNEVGINSFPMEYPDMEEVIEFVGSHFTGYSISHVSGRFRGKTVETRKQAGDLFAKGKYYLMDETTAIVRFIVPIDTTKNVYQSDAKFLETVVRDNPESAPVGEAGNELARVRWAFFHLFTEAVVRTVKGEDQVWLLESGPENRLYVWEKS